MYRFLLALVLLTASVLPTVAAEAPIFKVDPAYGAVYVQERIVVLPQDQDKLYLTVVGDPNDPQVKTVLNWFNTHNDLVAIKNQTHYRFMPTTGDSEPARYFRARYSAKTPYVPCIRLQKADGTLVVDLGPNQIPATPEALFNAVNRPATECFRKNNNSCPNPNPSPAPNTDPTPGPIHRTEPPAKPASKFPWILLGFVTLCGAGVGVYQKYRETYASK